jgi:hypothetical protein
MNLAWKEFRESFPPVALASGVILIIALWPALSGQRYGYFWGIGFHDSVNAILMFIALVLGVMAYAVEEEQETIGPLMARPVREHDVLATKLGVRLGLLFAVTIIIGIIELVTGAWPIEWDIPSPAGFIRWLSLVGHTVLGLGLGLYFGKLKKHQTSAFLIAAVVILVGVALLNLTPVRFLFEDEEGLTRWLWVRGIGFAGLGGTAAILAAIFASREPRRLLPAGVGALVGLAFYGVLAWSLTVVPLNETWMNPRAYFDYWDLRFGDPESAAEVLARRSRPFDEAPTGVDEAEFFPAWVLARTSASPPRTIDRYGYTRTSIIGDYPAVELPPSPRRIGRYDGISDSENYFVRHADDDRCREMLNVAAESHRPIFERMIALHAVSYAPQDLSDEIAGLLDDPSEYIRTMAAMLLLDRGDVRGTVALRQIAPGAIPVIQLEIMYISWRYDLDLDAGLGESVRSWLEGIAANPIGANNWGGGVYSVADTYDRHREGMRWMQRYGSRSDLDLIRRAKWAALRPARRDTTSLDQISIKGMLAAWDDPSYEGILRNDLRTSLQNLGPHWDRFEELSQTSAGFSFYRDRNRWYGTTEGKLYQRLRRYRSNLSSAMGALAKRRIPDLIELWREVRPYHELRDYVLYTPYGSDILLTMAEMGEAGFAELRGILDDPKAPPEYRVQSGLILIRQGQRELLSQVFHLWELYRNHPQSRTSYFMRWPVTEALLILLWEGNLELAEYVIATANQALGPDRATLRWGNYYSDFAVGEVIGPWYWNNGLVEVLKKASGEDFGWDLKAWTRWWEQEKVRLEAGSD